MTAHERACFYTAATYDREKLAFYFAVQSGGNFDVDYDIIGPDGNLLTHGQKARQADLIFSARKQGEYTFCFSNLMASYAEKVIDFDVTAEHELDPRLAKEMSMLPGHAQKKEKAKQELSKSEQIINSIQNRLYGFIREQRYYRTRENRNFDTVRSTESRVFWFATVETITMVAMACLQVFAIQSFFSASGSGGGGGGGYGGGYGGGGGGGGKLRI